MRQTRGLTGGFIAMDPLNMSLDDMVKAGRKKKSKDSARTESTTSRQSRRGRNRNQSFKQSRGDYRNNSSRAAARVTAKGSAVISNLHSKVTQRDLERLFENSTKVTMHKDRAGRSDGTADVQFVSHRDAQRACDKYHHVPLDGHPLQIRVTSQPPAAAAASSTPKSSTFTMMDADSLDTALDNYMMKRA